jgi:hypothetical protein
MHNVGEKEGATAVADLARSYEGTEVTLAVMKFVEIHTLWSGQEDQLHKCGGFNGDDRVCVGEEPRMTG